MVKRPLAFSLEALMRYPMETHIHFVECAGNSGAFSAPQPPQITAGELNGLLSCSEWTGVRLSTLLAEAGVNKEAKWVIAEGADAAAMSRSIPLEKCMDDAMIASVSKRRSDSPGTRFSDATAAAGIRRQYEREMAAPIECDGRASGCAGMRLRTTRN